MGSLVTTAPMLWRDSVGNIERPEGSAVRTMLKARGAMPPVAAVRSVTRGGGRAYLTGASPLSPERLRRV